MRRIVNAHYTETSRFPLARTVHLTDDGLRVGFGETSFGELNLPAMADSRLRGRWLGAGGAERPFAELPQGPGTVPVTRATGSCKPVRVRRAAEFAHVLGELAVRLSGGPEHVAAAAARAHAEGVPLWIARRYAPGPAGPVAVAVDRRLVRVDVWGPGAPVVRLRATHTPLTADDLHLPGRGLLLTVGGAPAALTVTSSVRKSRRKVIVGLSDRRWELVRVNSRASRLSRDGRPVADLVRPLRPVPDRRTGLLPLAGVDHHPAADPLDAVMAHTLAVSFGLGDGSGTVRFRYRRRHDHDPAWDEPWHTGLGTSGDDSGGGAGGDGWGGGDGGGGGGDGGGGGGE
ncbi:hypothetical protein GCM10027168_00060 [Streptomyces capparidis]